MLAPRYIRYGNIVTDLGTIDNSPECLPLTISCKSINAAKRHIRSLRLPPGSSQTIIFKSKRDRLHALCMMRKTLMADDNRDGRGRVAVRKIRWR